MPLWTLGALGVVFVPGVFGPQPLLLSIPVVGELLSEWRYDIAFLGLGTALVLVVSRNPVVRAMFVLVLLLVLQVFRAEPTFVVLFAVYLPTVVHVFVFTGLFMLWGALKGRSRSGYLTFAAFLAAAAAAFLVPGRELVEASGWARSNFGAFGSLTTSLLSDFGGMNPARAARIDLFQHPLAISVVRFLGFAYTYHYLNWFSKTSIIRWHEIPASRTVLIAALGVASIGLYFWDYALGLQWLYLLSFAHVVLEFPLNHRSVHGIATELGSRLAPARRQAA
jgi:hypothetical protein